ncbi:Aldo/keto reductase [Backusella circina FSU 941]|nr:Aldo/keto reductase [Backusella circina FSU 941]
MQYVRFGNTGLKVSRLCLGCMGFGSTQWQPWFLQEEESIKIIKEAYNAGVNFFDTADTYSNGQSEIILGKALKELNAPRSRIVVATKVYFPVFDYEEGPAGVATIQSNERMVNRWGNSRKHLLDAVDASLERLGLDYIDIYQIHRINNGTTFEELMEAMNDIVRSGKARYIGASSMPAWQFQKLNNIAEKRGWSKLISMQNCYNLLYREEEREMIPYCLDAGIAGMTWSPLAMGKLTGRNRNTTRTSSMVSFDNVFSRARNEGDEIIIDRVIEVGEKRGVSAAQVALAWVLSKKYVSSSVIGCSKIENFQDLMGALTLELTEEEKQYLEEPYLPKELLYNSSPKQ